MAKVTIKTADSYAVKLSQLEGHSDTIAKKAIYTGAGIVTDEVKKRLRSVVSDKATGELEASLGITPINIDKDGDWNAKVGFSGYDSNRVPNQLKARALESGTSRQKKKPFMRPAIAASKAKAKDAMAQVVDDEIKKLGF